LTLELTTDGAIILFGPSLRAYALQQILLEYTFSVDKEFSDRIRHYLLLFIVSVFVFARRNSKIDLRRKGQNQGTNLGLIYTW